MPDLSNYNAVQFDEDGALALEFKELKTNTSDFSTLMTKCFETL